MQELADIKTLWKRSASGVESKTNESEGILPSAGWNTQSEVQKFNNLLVGHGKGEQENIENKEAEDNRTKKTYSQALTCDVSSVTTKNSFRPGVDKSIVEQLILASIRK